MRYCAGNVHRRQHKYIQRSRCTHWDWNIINKAVTSVNNSSWSGCNNDGSNCFCAGMCGRLRNCLCKKKQKTLQPPTAYIVGKYGIMLTDTHTQVCTHAGVCPRQDTVNASFSRHLLQGKSGLEVVVWHQHSRSDTIHHRPPNMDTFITSWQENLVESNHPTLW